MSESELAAAITEDPDDPANDPEFWDRARIVYPRKERVSLGIDADVLAWFRRQGRGYQARINSVLRRHYERQVGQALDAVGITLHDHVIIGRNRHTSFENQGLSGF